MSDVVSIRYTRTALRNVSVALRAPSPILIACGVGLILGAAALQFSPLWALIALAGVGGAFVILKRPELGLLGIVIATSTIIPDASLPRFSVGIGTVYITDLLFFALLGLIVVRLLAERNFHLVRTPLDIPLLAFYALGMLFTVAAILQSSLTLTESLGRIRAASNYLIFFFVTNLVREDRQLRLLMRGLFALATIVAVAMIAQYWLGTSIQILPGRVETLNTEGEILLGMTRIIPPGYSLVFLAFTTITIALVLDKFRTATIGTFVQWLLLGVGVILTFKRHLWIGLGLAILLLPIYLSKKQDLQKLVGRGVGALILVVMSVALIIAAPESKVGRLGGAFLERLGSLVDNSTYEDPNSSLRWRDFEYQYALPQIASHPFVGLGWGGRHRPFVKGRDHVGFDGRSFVHNGHVSIVLQVGMLGYLSWLGLALISMFRGLKYARHIPDSQLRAWVLGFALTWVIVFFTSMVEPMVVEAYWTSLIGIALGVNEVVLRQFSQGPSVVR